MNSINLLYGILIFLFCGPIFASSSEQDPEQIFFEEKESFQVPSYVIKKELVIPTSIAPLVNPCKGNNKNFFQDFLYGEEKIPISKASFYLNSKESSSWLRHIYVSYKKHSSFTSCKKNVSPLEVYTCVGHEVSEQPPELLQICDKSIIGSDQTVDAKGVMTQLLVAYTANTTQNIFRSIYQQDPAHQPILGPLDVVIDPIFKTSVQEGGTEKIFALSTNQAYLSTESFHMEKPLNTLFLFPRSIENKKTKLMEFIAQIAHEYAHHVFLLLTKNHHVILKRTNNVFYKNQLAHDIYYQNGQNLSVTLPGTRLGIDSLGETFSTLFSFAILKKFYKEFFNRDLDLKFDCGNLKSEEICFISLAFLSEGKFSFPPPESKFYQPNNSPFIMYTSSNLPEVLEEFFREILKKQDSLESILRWGLQIGQTDLRLFNEFTFLKLVLSAAGSLSTTYSKNQCLLKSNLITAENPDFSSVFSQINCN